MKSSPPGAESDVLLLLHLSKQQTVRQVYQQKSDGPMINIAKSVASIFQVRRTFIYHEIFSVIVLFETERVVSIFQFEVGRSAGDRAEEDLGAFGVCKANYEKTKDGFK